MGSPSYWPSPSQSVVNVETTRRGCASGDRPLPPPRASMRAPPPSWRRWRASREKDRPLSAGPGEESGGSHLDRTPEPALTDLHPEVLWSPSRDRESRLGNFLAHCRETVDPAIEDTTTSWPGRSRTLRPFGASCLPTRDFDGTTGHRRFWLLGPCRERTGFAGAPSRTASTPSRQPRAGLTKWR